MAALCAAGFAAAGLGAAGFAAGGFGAGAAGFAAGAAGLATAAGLGCAGFAASGGFFVSGLAAGFGLAKKSGIDADADELGLLTGFAGTSAVGLLAGATAGFTGATAGATGFCTGRAGGVAMAGTAAFRAGCGFAGTLTGTLESTAVGGVSPPMALLTDSWLGAAGLRTVERVG